jgi:hypothetical protein
MQSSEIRVTFKWSTLGSVVMRCITAIWATVGLRIWSAETSNQYDQWAISVGTVMFLSIDRETPPKTTSLVLAWL